MSIFDSLKNKFSHNDEAEEEEFRTAMINGRYPDNVEDFEPLSTTGNFILPPEERASHFDDPLLAEGQAAYRSQGQLAFGQEDAAGQQPQDSYGQFPYGQESFGQTDFSPEGAGQDSYAVNEEESVRVLDADAEGVRPTTPDHSRTPAQAFRGRFQERAAAANVSGVLDENLGRSLAGTGSFAPLPQAVLRSASTDASTDELEREFEERRRIAEQERYERVLRTEQRNREFELLKLRSQQGEEGADADAEAGASTGAAYPSTASGPARGSIPANVSVPYPLPGASQEQVGVYTHEARTPAAPAAPSSMSRKMAFAAMPTGPVVIRVRTYDDVSEIARAVMVSHQPVVLPMRGTQRELSRRVLDFAFGLSCGSAARIVELEDRVFCVMPRGTKLGEHELASLRHQGILRA